MSKYRKNLPQLSDETFLTDGGLETTLLFKHGYDLPQFAAFDLFKHQEGFNTLKAYYQPYIDLALENRVNFILESPTYRASKDWGAQIGYDEKDLHEINRAAMDMLGDLRGNFEVQNSRFVISGCMGPRGDGYRVNKKMSIAEAEKYHWAQINTFRETEADMVTAFTMNYTEEAIGITRAAATADLPVAIGFTVETDGRLPSGQTLGQAITEVDLETSRKPVYYMINCAHPSHFMEPLLTDAPWLNRVKAIRANASAKSHAELDEAEELDSGDPIDLGRQYAALKCGLPNLNVFGGCCGTDHLHVGEIFNAIAPHHPTMNWDVCKVRGHKVH